MHGADFGSVYKEFPMYCFRIKSRCFVYINSRCISLRQPFLVALLLQHMLVQTPGIAIWSTVAYIWPIFKKQALHIERVPIFKCWIELVPMCIALPQNHQKCTNYTRWKLNIFFPLGCERKGYSIAFHTEKKGGKKRRIIKAKKSERPK